jgi:2OG-Fe(II) oxygenase superfamily
MPSIASELASLLNTVDRPGDFFVSGAMEHAAPRLEVEGVGVIALPLIPIQAEQLVAVAERAPYGRGADTVIDTQVRRTWQIGADRVRIGGKHWTASLQAILARVGEGLGVSEPIAAELYKLLLYDQGSFFVNHRDTEKAPGMFATLVVVLPSISTGGDLIVRHNGREAHLDLRCEEPSDLAFAAFYADCVHEVLPVTAGCRLTLVYNLVRKGKGPVPGPPSYARQQAQAAALLRSWATTKRPPAGDDTPEKLIYPLEHAYTSAELGFAALKGVDGAVTGVLVGAAEESGCDVALALLTIEESGAAEYVDDHGSRRGRWSEPDLEAGEIYERHVALTQWRQRDGSASPLDELPVEDNELVPPDALEDMEPDEEEFHEAAGNEGASFERSYSRAALVLWPRRRMLAVLNQGGSAATLPYLSELTQRWTAATDNERSPLWQQAHELAGHMLATWPRYRWSTPHDDSPSTAGRMLALLTALKDTARLDQFLADIAPGGLHGRSDNEAIVRALGLLPRQRAAALIERIIAGAAREALAACGDLLARAAGAWPHARVDLVGAATVLLDALPGDPARGPPRQPWQQPIAVEPALVVDLFTALERIDEALARRAADYVLAWREPYRLDDVLVPAACRLLQLPQCKSSASVERLRLACLDHLHARVAEPLQAPKDWSRVSTLSCSCPRCSELGHYLADAEHKTWIFRAAEHDRRHVEDTIRRSHCDVDVTTDRRGRPYSLVCTKNQASYQRRTAQRKADLKNLAILEHG